MQRALWWAMRGSRRLGETIRLISRPNGHLTREMIELTGQPSSCCYSRKLSKVSEFKRQKTEYGLTFWVNTLDKLCKVFLHESQVSRVVSMCSLEDCTQHTGTSRQMLGLGNQKGAIVIPSKCDCYFKYATPFLKSCRVLCFL